MACQILASVLGMFKGTTRLSASMSCWTVKLPLRKPHHTLQLSLHISAGLYSCTSQLFVATRRLTPRPHAQQTSSSRWGGGATISPAQQIRHQNVIGSITVPRDVDGWLSWSMLSSSVAISSLPSSFWRLSNRIDRNMSVLKRFQKAALTIMVSI